MESLECALCGALVSDVGKHARFHSEVDELRRRLTLVETAVVGTTGRVPRPVGLLDWTA